MKLVILPKHEDDKVQLVSGYDFRDPTHIPLPEDNSTKEFAKRYVGLSQKIIDQVLKDD